MNDRNLQNRKETCYLKIHTNTILSLKKSIHHSNQHLQKVKEIYFVTRLNIKKILKHLNEYFTFWEQSLRARIVTTVYNCHTYKIS